MRKSFLAISPALVLLAVAAVWAAQPAQSASEPAAYPEVAEYLNVPTPVFKGALISLLSHVSDTLSIVDHSLSVYDNDFSLANAISDCVDLLEISSDDLSRALSAIQTGKSSKAEDVGSALNNWLSAVYTNQERCMEGLEGTKTFMGTFVANRLSKVASLARQALGMVYIAPKPASNVAHLTSGDSGRRLLKSTKQDDSRHFPSWVSAKDRRLLQADPGSVPAPDAVVALDGTGNFTRIIDAVEAARAHSKGRFVIYIKKGVYRENVVLGTSNVMMYGDGMDATVITGNRGAADGWRTYQTATFGVEGSGFIARHLTFENTAGPEKHQAVAFQSRSDRSALFRCAFRGYQDTLYPHANHQFYRECTVTGTVDFIFGFATAVFQDCTILVKKGLDKQKNVVTSHGCNCSNSTGFSFQHCNISADADLLQALQRNLSVSTYLGRPWRNSSRTVVMESYISDIVAKEGWLDAEGNSSIAYRNALFYAEYNNSGPGADLSNRVKWATYHIFNSSDQAMEYTVARFIQGDSWLPQTGVRYYGGLAGH